jgi:hypothetical protein
MHSNWGKLQPCSRKEQLIARKACKTNQLIVLPLRLYFPRTVVCCCLRPNNARLATVFGFVPSPRSQSCVSFHKRSRYFLLAPGGNTQRSTCTQRGAHEPVRRTPCDAAQLSNKATPARHEPILYASLVRELDPGKRSERIWDTANTASGRARRRRRRTADPERGRLPLPLLRYVPTPVAIGHCVVEQRGRGRGRGRASEPASTT